MRATPAPGPGPDPSALAELVCGYCLDVAAGDQVLLRSSTLGAPLLLELQRAVLERGGWPLLRVELSGETEGFFTHARDRQLDGYPPLALAEAEHVDCRATVQAPFNTRSLAGVDPARLARAARARQPVSEVLLGRTRWCGTLWPTDAFAQQAGMSLSAYGAFVRRALFLDRPDPVAAWGELHDFQARLIERLTPAREIHIEGPGTDLRLRVDGRTWINSDGRRNMPSGEVFTGPLEASAQGTVTFSLPSGPAGVQVRGVRLTFEAGEVVASQADEGQEYLRAMIASDPGASRLGELGVGTNYGIDRPTGAVLLDEKIGGTVHLALGRSYRETGGVNSSALHWDLVCDLREGGVLSADGEAIQRDGRFLT